MQVVKFCWQHVNVWVRTVAKQGDGCMKRSGKPGAGYPVERAFFARISSARNDAFNSGRLVGSSWLGFAEQPSHEQARMAIHSLARHPQRVSVSILF